MSSQMEKISSMLSDDFSTTHWASPSRKTQKDTSPNILAEETIFSVDESVEFRVFGRHGWHVGKIVQRELIGDGTAMSYVYTVENLAVSFGRLGDIEGLKAGNIRRPADYSKHFSLAMNAPPLVEDFTPMRSLDIERPVSPLVGSTKHIGTSKVKSMSRSRVAATQKKPIEVDTYHTSNTQFTSSVGANETNNQEAIVSDTCSEVGSDETKSGTESVVEPAMPIAVSNLLRYGKTRGINTTMWFTPPEGWSECEKEKLVEGAFFIEKLTHLGLGLAVGRPLKEQLLIEEALSSHNLQEAVKVASHAHTATLGRTEGNATNLAVTDNTSSLSGAHVDIDWLVSTLGLSYEPSSPSSKSDALGNLNEGVTERVRTYAFNKQLFEGEVKPKLQESATQKQEEVQQVMSWEAVALQMEAKLKNMCRYHKDKFFKLRATLNMLEASSTTTLSQSSVYSDVSRVGAAAAAVFKSDTSVSCSVDDSLKDGSLEANPLQASIAANEDLVTLRELKKAFRVGEFNSWKLAEVEALIRTVTHTKNEADPTPPGVDRSALKEYLMSMMLQRKVGWEKWAASKTKEHHLFQSSLLDTFCDLVSGDIDSVGATDKLVDLVSKLEQAPPSLDVFQSEVYQGLLTCEATHLAEQWLNSSEARQKVRDKMVTMIETRRLEMTAQASGTDKQAAVTLFELYQRHVAQWIKLKRLNEEGGSEGDGEDGSSESHKSKPPSFNEWVDRYADPSGHVRRGSVEAVLMAKAEEYLNSEDTPAIELSCGAVPKQWKGLGEVERFTGEDGRKMVRFRPMLLTKQLLTQFILDKQPKSGFYDWLQTREKHREETKAKVGEWSKRKDKVKALIKAKASCCAVLSMDAGGMEGASDGHTIDGLVKSMIPFTEMMEGGPEGELGSFGVRKLSRKGLDIEKRLRKVAASGVEVKPLEKDQSALKLKEALKEVMCQYVIESDSSRVIHVDRVRIPSQGTGGFSDLRFKGNAAAGDESKSMHASKVFNYLYRQSDRRDFNHPNQNDMIVEVKVINSGKWHKALVLDASDCKLTSNQDAKKVQPKVSKRRSSVTTKPPTPKHPHHYTVRILKSCRTSRLEEEVELVLHKCAEQGMKYSDVVEPCGRVRVSCEQVDAQEALQGQHRVLQEVCAKVGKDAAPLKELPWVGPLALPGTAQMPKRRTHAFVVSKGVLDEELEPCLTSLLADRTANHSAKQLIDTFDYGLNRKCINQERLGLVVNQDVPSAKASVQQRLMESTNGMFHVEEKRQVEMAQELAAGRDRLADMAFKEWAKSKVVQKKKEVAAARKVEKAELAKLKEKEKENKNAYKEWAVSRKKKQYLCKANGEKKLKDWPVKNKPLVQRPWSFAPPVYEEEFI